MSGKRATGVRYTRKFLKRRGKGRAALVGCKRGGETWGFPFLTFLLPPQSQSSIGIGLLQLCRIILDKGDGGITVGNFSGDLRLKKGFADGAHSGAGGQAGIFHDFVAVEERFEQELIRFGAGEVLGVVVEVGIAAIPGLDVGTAHGNQAFGFGQGLEAADAAGGQHEGEHHVMRCLPT